MTTPTDSARIDALRATLTSEFEAHTARLTQLTADTGDPSDPHTQAALIATVRQSLEQITDALRRITEDTYGACERCGSTIPAERLEILPHARFCVPCQRKH
ncbi:TraR/DksA family transcriptional regulator [Micromonospora olivasterospora]|uniref:TraR/DksA family transcriptional regulator n=1 Tax=Micromonospora olivasterospora TaxID=1880 RepID=A0A562IFG9_MICOL|nr:TraR/DksA C4-type zinc finger protein [Micromonospora olivasterospora]TWH69710.1 TraR/DksA family transcriptional regulator [Micromonospora olivasterospora]